MRRHRICAHSSPLSSLVCFLGVSHARLSQLARVWVQSEVHKLTRSPLTETLSVGAGAVTHIVTKASSDRLAKRTIKYLWGVLQGKWVVSYDCMFLPLGRSFLLALRALDRRVALIY